MDVIGAGGPLGSRQLLTTQAQASQATQVDRPGRQSAQNRNSVRSVQETGSTGAAQAAREPNATATERRASRAVSAADIQNRENPLPRGSLVNILV